MQFNLTSDYAVRTVLYLAMNNHRPCSASELEREMGIPSLYLHKATKKLKQEQIIGTVLGNQGGYILKKKADEISLYDIFYLSEPTLKINACLETGECSAKRTGICEVRRVLCKLNTQMETELKHIKISDLLGKEEMVI